MEEHPLVSIITASYNADKTISDCLRSVSNQTFENYEHIVIDGKSTDETCKTLEQHSSVAPQLKWISETDSGIAEAMNKGIKMATGEWLLFLHADDQFRSSKSLEMASHHLGDCAKVVAYSVDFGSKAEVLKVVRSRGWCFKSRFKRTIAHQGAFIHRNLFDKLGLYDESYQIAMDYDWFMRAFYQKIPVSCHKEILSIMSDEGLSSRKDWLSLQARFEEDKRIHHSHAPNHYWSALYMIYWIIYPTYRRILHTICSALRALSKASIFNKNERLYA
ncbi:MAG: glycosyltransferase [Verrucomicrobia bacterium]|jgi:glycosyltransferase involved in cell wall biosynthesis|nr:glycosyltransferase [Verrucomicrobiota bacterium]